MPTIIHKNSIRYFIAQLWARNNVRKRRLTDQEIFDEVDKKFPGHGYSKTTIQHMRNLINDHYFDNPELQPEIWIKRYSKNEQGHRIAILDKRRRKYPR